MTNIICMCGHKLDDHDVGYCNQWELNACECSLNWDAVEARYWARRYYNRFNRMEYYANMLNDEVIKLREKLDAWEIVLTDSQTERDMLNVYADELKVKLDDAIEAFHKLDNWAKAYPLDIFPVPDLEKARKLLMDGGITLDAVSATAMRHVISGVAYIVQEALKKLEK